MVNILFYDDNDILSGNNVAKTIYDPACGTGGMLSVAEEYLHSLNASTELVSFGQEINDQTFAICKADMLIKGIILCIYSNAKRKNIAAVWSEGCGRNLQTFPYLFYETGNRGAFHLGCFAELYDLQNVL